MINKISTISLIILLFSLSLFANSNEPNVYFCEMDKFVEVGKDKVTNYNIEKFKFERNDEEIIFKNENFKLFSYSGLGDYKIDFYQFFDYSKKEYFFGNKGQYFFEFNDDQFTFSYVDQLNQPTTIVNIIATCEKF